MITNPEKTENNMEKQGLTPVTISEEPAGNLFEDASLDEDYTIPGGGGGDLPSSVSPPAEPVVPERNFLLLQGLMGPFFYHIGKALRARNYGVWKINFNGGDELFWSQPNGIAFRQTHDRWLPFLAEIIRKHNITDILLFGDSRVLHRQAVEYCRAHNIPVHVFEEGYIRPDWVTLELGGVNGNSSLPRDPAWYRDIAMRLPPVPPHKAVPSSFPRRATEGVLYNTATILLRWRYPHWRDYRPWPPLVEGVGWLKRLMRRRAAKKRSARLMEHLTKESVPYMLLPLQLEADAQLRLHSPFKGGIREVIDQVIDSFVRNAPEELCLVVKEHPLDNGVSDWKHYTAEVARKNGVADRVIYMEYGDINVAVKSARGVVTVNSTTGTLALANGVPVITLGHAVYNIDGVTYQGRLDDFWSKPGKPDSLTFAAFRRVLIERCLIAGGFFSREGLGKLVRGTLYRLEKHCPVAPESANESKNNMPEKNIDEAQHG